jgi:REP element-mobilizing transposase RayT
MHMGRKRLPHEVPAGASNSPEDELFFITICCKQREINSLAVPEVWERIGESMDYFENKGELAVRAALAMPDHFHALWRFPGTVAMPQVISGFKRWVARYGGVEWQRDFFDHRIRGWESAVEKAGYIRMNPVRAGLVERSEDWLFQR